MEDAKYAQKSHTCTKYRDAATSDGHVPVPSTALDYEVDSKSTEI